MSSARRRASTASGVRYINFRRGVSSSIVIGRRVDERDVVKTGSPERSADVRHPAWRPVADYLRATGVVVRLDADVRKFS